LDSQILASHIHDPVSVCSLRNMPYMAVSCTYTDQVLCCVVLCCAQTVANSLHHDCDPISIPSFACFP